MRKVMKSVSLVAVLCLLAAFLPLMGDKALTAFAADDGFTIEGGVLIAYDGMNNTVKIPDGVTEIKSDAFSAADTSAILTIVFPGSLKTVPADAFNACSSLREFYVQAANPYYSSVDGVLFSKNGQILKCYPAERPGKSYTVPASVNTILNYAFYHCDQLKSVILPENLTYVYDHAFVECGMTSVTFPEAVTDVSGSAFIGCHSLRTVTVLAAAGARVNANAFDDCSAIKRVNFNGTLEDWDRSTWKTALYNSGASSFEKYFFSYNSSDFTVENGTLTAYNGRGGNVVIPDGVAKIGNSAFKNTAITSVTLPSSVTNIGNSAFSGTRLTSVTIPASVTWIANNAFANCAALQEFRTEGGGHYHAIDGVLFCDNDTTIRRYPQGRTNSVYVVPSTVTKIGNYAFADCQSLTTVVLPDNLEKIFAWAFDNSGITYITIPARVTNLYGSTFRGCASLETVTILAPDAATYGASEFSGCTAIKNVYFEGTQARWESSSWKTGLDGSGSSYTVTPAFTVNEDGLLTEYNGEYGDVVIPDGVTGIDEFAFFGSGAQHLLKSVTVPASVTSIDACAFDYSSSLTAVNVAGDNPKYCSVDGVLFNKDKTRLARYPQGKTAKSYEVPSTVTVVGESAFYHCEALTSVRLPASLTTLQGYALNACSSLTNLTIPASVTRVGEYAFGNCKALRAVTILAKSPAVSTYPFSGAPVETVYYAGSESEWNASGWKKVLADAAVTCDCGDITVTTQPKDATGQINEKVTFTVAATGAGISYKWYYKKADATSWTAWKNGTSPTLTATVYASWNGTKFFCKITDASGSTVNSGSARMLVATAITQQPTDATGAVNDKVTFSVKATGAGISYQWYYKKPGDSSWTAWNGRTSASATATVYASWNGTKFYCKITDANGKTINSDSAKMYVATTITQQPTDATGAVNEKVTFSVVATGSGVKYQWYYKKADASSWTAWKNGTSASLTATVYNSWNNAKFYCKLTDSNGKTVNSDAARMLVAAPLAITTQPKDATGAVNEKVTFTVKATGSGISYKWYYKKADASSWTAWKNGTSASLTAPVYASWNGAKFYCKLTDSSGNTLNSGSAKMYVATKITQQPTDATGAVGEKVTFSVKATGAGISYKWYYKKADASSWTEWKNGTSASLTATVYNS